MQHISDSCTPKNKTALVIKALLSQEQRSADPLAEVIALADTAGVEVLDSLVQKLRRPNRQPGSAKERSRRPVSWQMNSMSTSSSPTTT
mgnify:CR=1 FL=1